MKRFGQVIKLKPHKIEKYKKLHANAWPEVLKTINRCNMRNYSIFLKDDLLFSYFEYMGSDFDADMEQMAANPVTQEWWAACKPCMIPLEKREDGEWWSNLEEIFHLE